MDNFSKSVDNYIKPPYKPVDNYLFDMWITLWYDGYMNDLFWYSRQLREAVSTTGMENGWNDAKCKEVFDSLMDNYLVSKDLKWNYTMARWLLTTLWGYMFMTGDIPSDMSGR